MANYSNYGGSIQNVGSPNLRIDAGTADAYTRVEPPKLTFMQKLGRGLAKTMGFLGPIGAAVAGVTLGPLGLPVAAGLYGLTKFSQDKLYQANIKDQIAMSSQQQPQSIHQEMSFSAFDEFSPIKPHVLSLRGRTHTLAVGTGATGVGLSPLPLPFVFAQFGHQGLPHAIATPGVEVAIDG